MKKASTGDGGIDSAQQANLAAARTAVTPVLEAALSFLGFGVPVPTASWGRMVADGQDVLESAWWLATLPGICIVLTVLGFALVADGLRDRLDPALAPTSPTPNP